MSKSLRVRVTVFVDVEPEYVPWHEITPGQIRKHVAKTVEDAAREAYKADPYANVEYNVAWADR